MCGSRGTLGSVTSSVPLTMLRSPTGPECEVLQQLFRSCSRQQHSQKLCHQGAQRILIIAPHDLSTINTVYLISPDPR